MGERREEMQNAKLRIEERIEKKGEYLELKSQLTNLQESGTSALDSTKQVYNLLMESNKMVDNVLDPQTVSLDADLLSTASDILRKHVEALTICNRSFSAEEFGEAILTYMGVESGDDVPDEKWKCFEGITRDAYKRTETPFFMRNHIDNLSEVAPVTRVPKQRRGRDTEEARHGTQTKRPENVKVARKEEDGIEQSVGRMMHIIMTEYKENGNKPLCFFTLVINPDSFSATVENIFHFSFLVKDRMVDFIMDSEGDPRVVPVCGRRGAGNGEGSQTIVSITMAQWQELIKLYKIKKAMITPMR